MDSLLRLLAPEDPAGKSCAADCGDCSTFPAPFRRAGDLAHCRFSPLHLHLDERTAFPADRAVRLVFVLSGALSLDCGEEATTVAASQCACMGCGERVAALARAETRAVVLSLAHRMELCERDIFGNEAPDNSARPPETVSVLPMHRSLERLCSGIFDVDGLNGCARYHRMKATEVFMMIRALYTASEQARFFRSMIRSDDDFRVFVRNNYERAGGVGELAALAGMSLTVFKRRFAEQFHDSVYHWMMQQKASRILTDIRDGERSTRALMAKYGFRHYTQFSRFCKNCLQATPAQLIAAAERKRGGRE